MKLGKDVFIANTATVTADVTLGDQASVWFGAVIRGDADSITIGDRTNIQDTAVVHADEGVPTHIGQDVTVGHGAIVHGATVGDFSLIGMRATILNGAKVGAYCVIGAHSLITEGKEIPEGSLVMGAPAKVIRPLTEEEKNKLAASAEHYVHNAADYMSGKYEE
ncbi:MAG: gamma carbonic anhydrase family protein [Bacteroidota bacterium]